MSGGSYDYLYCKDSDDLFAGQGREDLERMAERLAGLGYAVDAATDTHDLIAMIRTQQVRLDAAVRRLSGVFKAVEWWDSNDWGEDKVRDALAQYRGEKDTPVERLQAVAVQPSDVIVATVPSKIRAPEAAAIRDHLARSWPDNRISVISGGVELAVYRPEDAAAPASTRPDPGIPERAE